VLGRAVYSRCHFAQMSQRNQPHQIMNPKVMSPAFDDGGCLSWLQIAPCAAALGHS
jgi:hypothetical protein